MKSFHFFYVFVCSGVILSKSKLTFIIVGACLLSKSRIKYMSVGQLQASKYYYSYAMCKCDVRMKKENDGKKTVPFQVIVHKQKTSTTLCQMGKKQQWKNEKALAEAMNECFRMDSSVYVERFSKVFFYLLLQKFGSIWICLIRLCTHKCGMCMHGFSFILWKKRHFHS